MGLGRGEKDTGVVTEKIRKWGRCKKCREMVSDPDNCGNCANRANPLSMSKTNVPDRRPVDYIPGSGHRIEPTNRDE